MGSAIARLRVAETKLAEAAHQATGTEFSVSVSFSQYNESGDKAHALHSPLLASHLLHPYLLTQLPPSLAGAARLFHPVLLRLVSDLDRTCNPRWLRSSRSTRRRTA